jgi:hypothetical protein
MLVLDSPPLPPPLLPPVPALVLPPLPDVLFVDEFEQPAVAKVVKNNTITPKMRIKHISS